MQNLPIDEVDSVLRPVEAACNALVAALQAALPADEATPPGGASDGMPVDAAAAQQLVDRLAALLAEDDSDAIELFKESAGPLHAHLGPAYGQIKRALDSYDFLEALAALRQTAPTDIRNNKEPHHE